MIEPVGLARIVAVLRQSPVDDKKPADIPTVLSAAQQKHIDEARAASDLGLSMAQRRRGAAREAIEQIKKQLADLALVAALDPKSMARLLNGLAKRLANAVQTYAEAGNPAELKAEAALIEDGIARIQPKAEPEPLSGEQALQAERHRVAQAYLDMIPPEQKEDESFLVEVERLKNRLKSMFEAALAQAARQGEDAKTQEDLAAGFTDSLDIISKGEKAIAGHWTQPAAPTTLSPVAVNLIA